MHITDWHNFACVPAMWQSELFVLATDQGFLNESNVVWETLSNVEGDGHFVDAAFHTYRLPEMPSQRPVTVPAPAFPAPPANSKEQIDHEYVPVCLVMIAQHHHLFGTFTVSDTSCVAYYRIQFLAEVSSNAVKITYYFL